jgi:hypothetical protein
MPVDNKAVEEPKTVETNESTESPPIESTTEKADAKTTTTTLPKDEAAVEESSEESSEDDDEPLILLKGETNKEAFFRHFPYPGLWQALRNEAAWEKSDSDDETDYVA